MERSGVAPCALRGRGGVPGGKGTWRWRLETGAEGQAAYALTSVAKDMMVMEIQYDGQEHADGEHGNKEA